MNVAEIVGYVVIAGLWVMMAAASVAAACAAVQMLLNRHASSVADKTRREIGNAMLSDAWWFGEDRGAQEVLRLYGRTMADGYRTDPNQVRERWRTAIAPDKPTEGA